MYAVFNSEPSEEDLEHFGVKGMKWGVRREAKRDAKESAQAKMYYGKGAGTRRKLIKATVESKSKDPYYKSEFDKAYANQDMAQRASQARGQRSRKDAKEATGKKYRTFKRTVGPIASMVAIGAATAYYGTHKDQVDNAVINGLGKVANEAMNFNSNMAMRKSANLGKQFLRNMNR